MATYYKYVRVSANSGGDGDTNADSGAGTAYAYDSLLTGLGDMATETGIWTTSDDVVICCINGGGGADVMTWVTQHDVDSWATKPASLTIRGGIPSTHPTESAEEERNDGLWDTNRYIAQGDGTGNASSRGIHIYTGSATVLKLFQLQATSTGTNAAAHGIQMQVNVAAGTGIIDSCIVKDTAGGDGIVLNADRDTTTTKAVIVNCIVYGCAGTGIDDGSANQNATSLIANNTIYGCTNNGISWTQQAGYSANGYLYNNLSTANTSSDAVIANFNNYTATSNLNDDGTAATFFDVDAPTYNNAAGGDFSPASDTDSMVGVGVDMSANGIYNYNWDIAGNTRSSWDSGAIAYVATSSSVAIKETSLTHSSADPVIDELRHNKLTADVSTNKWIAH